MNKKYIPPAILKEVTINVSHDLLSSSVVTSDTEVESMGQEVVDYEFSSYGWNLDWE